MKCLHCVCCCHLCVLIWFGCEDYRVIFIPSNELDLLQIRQPFPHHFISNRIPWIFPHLFLLSSTYHTQALVYLLVCLLFDPLPNLDYDRMVVAVCSLHHPSEHLDLLIIATSQFLTRFCFSFSGVCFLEFVLCLAHSRYSTSIRLVNS